MSTRRWILPVICGLHMGSAALGARLPGGTAEDRAWKGMQDRYPGVQAYVAGEHVRTVYGRPMAAGATAVVAADRFRRDHARLFGVDPDDLQAGLHVTDGRTTQPIMYDRSTGRYKFTLVYYSQFREGIPVFRSDLRVLVRNDPSPVVVQVTSSLHRLGTFEVGVRAPTLDPHVAYNAVVDASPELEAYTLGEMVIFAGVDDEVVDPTLAYTYLGVSGRPERWLFVVDAQTGEILYRESLIQTEDVIGTVSALATKGAAAEQCADELPEPMPYARVSIGTTVAYADSDGVFSIPNGGTSAVTVESAVRGQWFRVYNMAGSDTTLSQTVTPPGPADFLHNAANSEFTRAEVNAYVQANVVRDFTLYHNPSYPTLQQPESPVYVNRNDFVCPANAWWDPLDLSLNFCRSSSPYPNSAFASVVHHEYGHHLVNAAGSGQDQYGEGMGDVMSLLIADDPNLGVGFLGNCITPLRNANNTIQYPCIGEAHDCAGLLSGAVWDTRNELAITDPFDYIDILGSLAVNAMLLHTGSSITPQIAIDYLTLDDDDGVIGNGTPHRSAICTGFGAHNLDCPALTLIEFEYPDGLPAMITPDVAEAVRVNVLPIVANPVPGTGTLSYSIDGVSYTTVAMNEIAPNEYEAVLPATACGENLRFYFSAESDAPGGSPVNDPPDATASPFTVLVATGITTVASFDFETSTGWTVSGNASDGQWVTGIPVNYNRGDPPSDFDGSGRCYLTDNVAGNSDVDGGTTTLTSPAFDVDGLTTAYVSYARWYSNTEGDSPQADTFVIWISNDDGTTWSALEAVGPTGEEVFGGWYAKTFRIADFVPPTSAVKVRFDASDLGAGSIVEAAVDAFDVFALQCGVEMPAAAPSPHDARKNRYVSFAPNNGPAAVAFAVELIAGPGAAGALGWVDQPEEPVPGEYVARVVDTPAYRVWSEPVIHLGDCEIVPVATYGIRATADGVVFSDAMIIGTIRKPGVRYYGDVVGAGTGDLPPLPGFTGPNGVVNVTDVQAYILTAQGDSSPSAHTTWVDLHGLGVGSPPNFILNVSDVQRIKFGFEGTAYTDTPEQLNPMDCP
ncbi:MAG: hypothetical protein ACE5HE_08420 [Phycisphaerae bacterium]